MEVCSIIIAFVAVAILGLFAYTTQAIATICKHGGVTIRIIREEQDIKIPIVPETVMSKADQEAMDKYNEQQSEFLNSIRNLQKIFINDDQMSKED